ncbi:E3 ubiquitin-protein ligase MIEL1 isoform X2 [Ananas comosus]|uniref:E3 ubiquitin-protein ligase MIEL1 isoform X2 n=1 Tax=Ananas comosus TaxID=4615 RepID=A0A6P5FTR8_ANACO|nr:E3 ubiquitin-protein ligase MIEL1 isoform X2 [Ananas comosus]
MDVHITDEDAGSELPVVMRYLIVDTATMKQKTQLMWIGGRDMTCLVNNCSRLYVHCVVLNKRYDKYASTAVYAWGSTSVQHASCSMMMSVSKQQYHCNGCGICRIGGRENFFHCYRCGCCYSTILKNSHACVEGAMHHDCPVCFEYLFESRYDVSVLPCGHTIHVHCLKEMREHLQYACPLCSKSVCDMSKVWEKLDMEIAATPMPESFQNKMVRILCNDCGATSQVQFHVVAQKCQKCKSYNTRQT